MNEKEQTKATCKKLTSLLSTTKRIVKHNKELTIAKGEHFNLFSVLDIETKENKTHSAFLTELLNPDGSHQMGDVFLKLFLEILVPVVTNDNEEDKTTLKISQFNTSNPFVKAEYSIGKINLYEKEGEDVSMAKGGRIDIYLKDINNTIICIENKIHAGDQPKQIQRYYNHNTSKNTVFHLTLKGGDPSKESKLELSSGEDFYNISYREHIVQWLELCLKEVSNFTYLREAINQYILLIKKLTHTMNKEQEKELLEIMMANIEESKFVANNYEKALNKLRNNFREDLMKALRLKLGDKNYDVLEGKPVKNKFSQIWLHFKSNPQPQILFGVESFSGRGHYNGDMFVGLLDKYKSPAVANLPEENRLNGMWKQVRFIKTEKKNNINLGHNYTINILNDKTSDDYKTLLNTCCTQIVAFIEDYEQKLSPELFQSKLIEN
ncbi:PD-(D/E)XK nuclease superfamily protein [Lutibacter agarilyticus]|uniref:PD-(D/E)XK nuclease superfamily protein n=1 Tax=Lutibacter agarilyticus TaxID=1109740 RepID=A0A238WWX4_9FLAO|nr:PD-(D/E)XK nuclease family protein [Lutibacter agarilyticus]SNR50933.1 PD-(D/E)XK nuclease superfamily protein [Lutibacter agarilyticus]